MKTDIFAEADTTPRIVSEKPWKGELDRQYIPSDHGFVSLPRPVDTDAPQPPSNADKVTPRWVAGAALDDEDGISILTDPSRRFRNQGLQATRLYHGGALPREFLPNAVTTTRE
jgi:hypothetical protein